MIKLKQTVIGAVIGVGLGLSSSALATGWPSYDAKRAVEFAIQGIQRTLFLVSEYQKVESKEKELKLWQVRKDNKPEEGTEGESEGTGEGEGEGEEEEIPQKLPKASPFYETMAAHFGITVDEEEAEEGEEAGEKTEEDSETELEEPSSWGYLPNGSDAEYIREKFFYDSNLENVTEEQIQEVTQLRYAYMESLAKEVMAISARARQAIAGELETIVGSKTTAGGDVNQVQFLAQTKKVMVEQKAADLMLQAKLFEMEAAELLMGLNPQRIEKPEETKTSSTEGED